MIISAGVALAVIIGYIIYLVKCERFTTTSKVDPERPVIL